jgi:hypothetical protein
MGEHGRVVIDGAAGGTKGDTGRFEAQVFSDGNEFEQGSGDVTKEEHNKKYHNRCKVVSDFLVV